jgi:hypothetical protein
VEGWWWPGLALLCVARASPTCRPLTTRICPFPRAPLPLPARLQVLCSAEFRLQTVIEAAMEIAGLHAAQKRLQIAYNISHSGALSCWACWAC